MTQLSTRMGVFIVSPIMTELFPESYTFLQFDDRKAVFGLCEIRADSKRP